MPWSRFGYVRCLLGIFACGPVWMMGAELHYPLSIAVTKSNVIYLADRNLPGVWKLEGEKLSVLFEGSRQFRTPLNAIRCLAIDSDGKLLAGDSSTREVYRFDDAGQPVGLTHRPTTPAEPSTPAKKDAPPADQPAEAKPVKEPPAPVAVQRKYPFGEIGIPMDIAVNKAGDLFVADLEIHRVVKVARQGGPAVEFAQIQAPRGLCLDDEENLWVVSGRRLVKLSPTGEKTTVVEEGTFNFPHTVAVTSDKTAYVCDGYEKCIWKVTLGGKPEKLVSGEPLMNPVGMRLVADKLYVVDPRAKAVFQITLDGKLTPMPMKP